jgi:hypothetical protein
MNSERYGSKDTSPGANTSIAENISADENAKFCYTCGDPLPEKNPGGKPYHFSHCPKCRQYRLDKILDDPEIQANRRAMEASILHRR